AELAHQVVDDRHRPRLGSRWELASYELLAEQLTQIVVGGVDATLPARADLRRSGEQLVELEALPHEGRAQRRRRGIHQAPAEQRLPVGNRNCGQHPVEVLVKLRLGDVDLVWNRRAKRRVELLPREVWCE